MEFLIEIPISESLEAIAPIFTSFKYPVETISTKGSRSSIPQTLLLFIRDLCLKNQKWTIYRITSYFQLLLRSLNPVSKTFSDLGPFLLSTGSFSNKELRALPRSCLFYLFDSKPCAENITFMQRLSTSEHSTFYITLASQLFQQPDPAVKRVLDAAAGHGSNGAKYFLMILNVLAEGGFSVGKVLTVFIDLFVDEQLARCRRSLMNLGGHLDSAFLPRGLVYRRTYESGGTCEGSKTKPQLVRPLPEPDEEYLMPGISLFCRLDLENTWFFVHFHFMEN